MSAPIISQPDITSTQVTDSISAAQSVTNYAQAAVTTVPQPDDMPDWFTPINADITVVKTHAQNWLNEICPAISNSIPESIINFNQNFQQSSSGILTLLQKIVQQPGSLPTMDQQKLVNNYLSSIQTNATNQSNVVNTILQNVKKAAANTNSDQQKIASDLNLIATKITSGAASIDQMQTAIGEGFLDNTTLGPCNVIVNINMNIVLKITGMNIDPTIICTVYANAILQNLLNNTQASQKCVQTIVDTWAIMQTKFSDVITDLADVASDQFTAYLQQLDFATAKIQWQQLADFASTLVQSSTMATAN